MSPFAEQRAARPVGSGRVFEVDGGLWQGRCACRWHGRRHHERNDADLETARHVASCGICILIGREAMDRCTCRPCVTRREVRARWTVETPANGEQS